MTTISSAFVVALGALNGVLVAYDPASAPPGMHAMTALILLPIAWSALLQAGRRRAIIGTVLGLVAVALLYVGLKMWATSV
ncbi:hypothetical protein [uncultured Deinococcus sp.]|uniref:hypothetical protein n=1 Tax=uncultured Deinococcus sp. TaxID=158789 RepID=UPI0025F551C7|nr:hypothetical protein [uncultured Deinococcus sp.]